MARLTKMTGKSVAGLRFEPGTNQTPNSQQSRCDMIPLQIGRPGPRIRGGGGEKTEVRRRFPAAQD